MERINYDYDFEKLCQRCENDIYQMFKENNSDGFAFKNGSIDRLALIVSEGEGIFKPHYFESCRFTPRNEKCCIDLLYLIDTEGNQFVLADLMEWDLMDFYNIVYEHFYYDNEQ